MDRRPRLDVVDHDRLIVLIGDLRGDLPGDDLFEKGHGRNLTTEAQRHGRKKKKSPIYTDDHR